MATNICADTDLFEHGIATWAQQVRDKQFTFEETIAACLARAKANEQLGAFECLDSDRARVTAAAMDKLLASGRDLGPLMGLPIGVKDIIAVEGLPTTNGSNADTAHLTGEEGSLVQTLKAAGAIVLGKTKTVEFALGATGVNESRGTPWNPVDRETHRMPGGSSSGSAVAVSAGIVGLGLGSDTGGSIRIPACMTGIVGHKTSMGRWPTDGIFPLCQTFDSAGPLCRTVDDAALLHTLMTGESITARQSLSGFRFGVPGTYFLDDLDEKVSDDFNRACDALIAAGAIRYDIDFPEAIERAYIMPDIIGAEIIANLTPELFSEIRDGMDTVSAQRSAHGLQVSAVEYVTAQQRRAHLDAKAHLSFQQVDCWITPTCPFEPIAIADIESGKLHERALLASRNTQPGNMLGFCGISLPMHQNGLPTGLQMLMPTGADKALLEVSNAIAKAIA
ncbi:MAG: amidase [Granulosicoccus sp.]